MSEVKANYYFDSENRFVIENYNWSKPHSNFFPGIAGKFGIPMWIYYVNRGQAICSMGTKDKDGAILEFLSFNRACQLVGIQGFRTFIKLESGEIYEPFQRQVAEDIRQMMTITSGELVLAEENEPHNLNVSIEYFPLVGMPISALIRKVSIHNTSDTTRKVEVVDGHPRILPFGVSFEHMKVIPRHIEAMMGVFELQGIPMFRLKQSPADISQVGEVAGANYYLSTTSTGRVLKGCYITDPQLLFGLPNNFDIPWNLTENSALELLSSPGARENRTPCGFTVLDQTLEIGGSFSFYSIIGHSLDEDHLTSLIEDLGTPDFYLERREENLALVEEIKGNSWINSNIPLFDSYCQETFLENAMRGGIPAFPSERSQAPQYIYTRQNGDLERDYHWFVLEPSYYSQGNGHYRSICQNRRMDAWFFPRTFDHNLHTFMNLIQLDGYNPLVVNLQRFIALERGTVDRFLATNIENASHLENLLALASSPFTPGEFLLGLENIASITGKEAEQILAGLLEVCEPMEIGDTHAGFWIDHWAYNLDLLETLLSIYPDKLREIIIDRRDYTFFDNADVVLPRQEKYILQDGKVRQYHAMQQDIEKLRLISARKIAPNKVRRGHGSGEIYETNLLVKLLSVLTNRIAALDPRGIGVEMEADKPGWNDSLNGLPGLFGSSLCQTLELIRMLRFLQRILTRPKLEEDETILVYEELVTFMDGLKDTLLSYRVNKDQFLRWNRCHELLETYRAATRLGISGEEDGLTIIAIRSFVNTCLNFLEAIFEDSNKENLFNANGIPYTYFTHKVNDFKILGDTNVNKTLSEKISAVTPLEFEAKSCPIFLEGPVHYLRVFPQEARNIYKAVRESALFDPKLKMYKVCESLNDQPIEIGRIRAYPSGWLENGSIYTHMEFKWLLEILRSGLYKEFFNEIHTLLPPFMDPATYGRSTIENCSFIVSSAFTDSALHGQAFQPRLSGVTAEMLEMWTIMVAGPHPFRLDQKGDLNIYLEPILPDWLFTEAEKAVIIPDEELGQQEITFPANSFAFRFLGSAIVIYHNPRRKSTFGDDSAHIQRSQITYRHGGEIQVDGQSYGKSIAESFRRGEIEKLEAWLG